MNGGSIHWAFQQLQGLCLPKGRLHNGSQSSLSLGYEKVNCGTLNFGTLWWDSWLPRCYDNIPYQDTPRSCMLIVSS